MPQYDYRCQECREAFTIERSMSESGDPCCVHCGSGTTTRIWGAIIVAGSSTPDVGQGGSTQTASKKSGCGSCSSHSCGTC